MPAVKEKWFLAVLPLSSLTFSFVVVVLALIIVVVVVAFLRLAVVVVLLVVLARSSTQIVDCCCNFDALFDGRCCLKFASTDVDDPLVELMPLLSLSPFGIHDVL